MDVTGFAIGALFGAFLFLAGLANPDKMVGALRLKDLHAMRVIAVFVLVGLAGTTLLDALGVAHFSVKPAAVLSVLLGGSLLGIGMGITGYCPGTGLACGAAGRLDGLVSVVGMLFGALVYILIQPTLAAPLDDLVNLGKQTLPEWTGIARGVWTLVFVVPGAALLWFTRPGRPPRKNVTADKADSRLPSPSAG